ncbi:heavy metal translocating P-type ATPase [Telluria beijingensis]|uniref:heavy metal translocating P-type ATPase n=1 Tax=Telluria beijingensis TaxID=3068633 RepID=UPI0027962525|nr:heavy metal translocating P-type ATPase [Massilia sp. REN29]
MSAVLEEAVRDVAAAAAVRALPAGCFHCGLPVPAAGNWHATIGGNVQRMCCPGCAAAAEAIVDGGFADYYATRTAYAAQADIEAANAPELDLLDGAGLDGEASFTVEGIRCAACVWLIERRLRQLPGVLDASLNVATERLFVRWDPATCRPSVILRTLRAIGYGAFPYDAQRHGERLERARRKLFRQLFVAGLSMMQVMMYAVPVYMADEGTMDAAMTALMHWASFVLTLPALLYSAQPFFAGAWRDLRRGMPGMDVPVALGIGAAFAGSVHALLAGAGDVYFDSVTMFVFLLLGSRYLELNARRKAAGALERLQQGLPPSALRLRGNAHLRDTELVRAASLRVDDLVLVRAGQAAPADGVIVEGTTEVDLALLTGESRTQARGVGDAVPGGAVNVAEAIVLRVSSTAHDSLLSMLVRLVERAGQGKPALALWADRVAAWFVLALLGLTVLAWFAWQQVDPGKAWQVAIAVLVVSCPCALSLATPTALAAATNRLLRRGVLAVQPHTLETLDRATHVVFDKTGTLTHGRPLLRQTLSVGGMAGLDCLRVAAALEADNPHPLAQAIRDAAAAENGDAAHAERTQFTVGQGVAGWVDGRYYRVGSAAWVAGVAGGAARAAVPAGTTSVWLGNSEGWLARFDLADGLRPEAAEVVRRIRAGGKAVVLLSGDEQHAAQAVAAELGIPTAIGGKLPQEKLAYVRRLQQDGAVVAMIGDGINDAAVLRGADVSFAMGRGAELAQLHADGVLMGDSLAPLADTLDTSRRTLAVIRQNLTWATVYNLAAIPAAAMGLLNPWMAGIGMAASSAVVVLNALRLRKD